MGPWYGSMVWVHGIGPWYGSMVWVHGVVAAEDPACFKDMEAWILGCLHAWMLAG
jgi:hypothetical protein